MCFLSMAEILLTLHKAEMNHSFIHSFIHLRVHVWPACTSTSSVCEAQMMGGSINDLQLNKSSSCEILMVLIARCYPIG